MSASTSAYLKVITVIASFVMIVPNGFLAIPTMLQNREATRPTLIAHASAAITKAALEPGDIINGVKLSKVARYDENVLAAEAFCQTSQSSPIQSMQVCDVPLLSRIYLSECIFAYDQSALETLWKGVRYDIFIDGYPVDLAAFGTIDLSGTVGDIQTRNRDYIFELDVIAPGRHTERTTLHIPVPLNNGVGTAPAGDVNSMKILNIGTANDDTACPDLPSLARLATVSSTLTATQTDTSDNATNSPVTADFPDAQISCGTEMVEEVRPVFISAHNGKSCGLKLVCVFDQRCISAIV